MVRGDNKTRFLAKVRFEGTHWFWTGGSKCHGGMFRLTDARRMHPNRAGFAIFCGEPGAFSVVRSCGNLECVNPKHQQLTPSTAWKHGESSRTPENKCWENLVKTNRVAAAWLTYERFLADVGRRPSPRYAFRLIDRRKPYGPGNARWKKAASYSVGYRGVKIGGRTQSLAAWAREYEQPYARVLSRLRIGYDVKTALKSPLSSGKRLSCR